MEETSLRSSLVNTKSDEEKKYIKTVELNFDYQKNHLELINIEKLSLLEKFPDNLVDKLYNCEKVSIFKKNFIKGLVSKKKIRFTNNLFDLDLIYITKRVMAMGFPSVSCESLIRNSIKDVKRFFSHYHKNNVKIFNLCIEENRIYDKEIFQGLKVGLFPSADHSSCPVKLIFEFCVDLSMFLLQDEENVGAVHCKAGKGRTGVMICCYLIFSGICKDTNKAIEEYAERRSYIKKGVTIPSQKRYIHHFETFLQSNFTKPYYKLIPKIVNNFLTPSNNLLINMLKDKSYHEFINVFNLKKIKIGPFSNRLSLNFVLKNFKNQKKFDSSDKFEKINFKYFIKEEINSNTGKSMSYSILEFNENFLIDCDINLIVNSKGIKFNTWLNLFFITLEYYYVHIQELMKLNILSTPSPRKDKEDRGFKRQMSIIGGKCNEFKQKNQSCNLVELGDMTNIMKKNSANTEKKKVSFKMDLEIKDNENKQKFNENINKNKKESK